MLLVAADPWRVVYANPVAANLFRTSPEKLAGQSLVKLIDGASADTAFLALEAEVTGGSFNDAIGIEIVPTVGERRSVSARFCRVHVERAVLVAIVLGSEIAATTNASRWDPLTGLLDREFLECWLTQALCGNRSSDRCFAVLFIDVDNFKSVNDRHGHLVGDRVLREAALQLMNCVSQKGWPVRYGGDEFVVLVRDTEAANNIESLVDEIRQGVSQPIEVPDGEVRLSLSVGVAIGPGDFQTPDEIIAAADRAMYAAKRAGG